jgi:hypothetical protein
MTMQYTHMQTSNAGELSKTFLGRLRLSAEIILEGVARMENQKLTRIFGWLFMVGVLGFASGIGLFLLVSRIQ